MESNKPNKPQIAICPLFKQTGRCSFKENCPNVLAHRRCKFFLYGSCTSQNCPFFHDFNERARIVPGEFCENFRKTGKCALGPGCKFSFFHKKCKYFIQSECKKGINCFYYHDLFAKHQIAARKKPKEKPKSSQQVCKFYNQDKCKFGENCKDLHICYYFSLGQCKFGPRCKYSHEKPNNLSNNDTNFDSDSAISVVSIQSNTKKEENVGLCCICLFNKATHATVPCGHKNYCEECCVRLKFCAICRQIIQTIIKIY